MDGFKEITVLDIPTGLEFNVFIPEEQQELYPDVNYVLTGHGEMKIELGQYLEII